ncbi:hypothetical protein BDU57DRAFT_465957 [Ampelomyces quisqualis]|uniref:Uncharacterized protein n=1 Tax=Ampelomyces quisqualis TaxID=50730 RepID=A0A6A5R1H2_AMPQU|nr:hypothetical protein BDU57DRAFT_465957 [Ampelomyces quisqualis]
MKEQFSKGASYVLPGGTKAERHQGQELWDEYQRQQRSQKELMGDVDEDSKSKMSTRRTRADSHQPTSHTWQDSADASHPEFNNSSTHVKSYQDYDEYPRRFSSASTGHLYGLSPQLSPSSPYGGVRRISNNFNAPTDVELERTREHIKSLKGVEKLRSKVKRWVRA